MGEMKKLDARLGEELAASREELAAAREERAAARYKERAARAEVAAAWLKMGTVVDKVRSAAAAEALEKLAERGEA